MMLLLLLLPLLLPLCPVRLLLLLLLLLTRIYHQVELIEERLEREELEMRRSKADDAERRYTYIYIWIHAAIFDGSFCEFIKSSPSC